MLIRDRSDKLLDVVDQPPLVVSLDRRATSVASATAANRSAASQLLRPLDAAIFRPEKSDLQSSNNAAVVDAVVWPASSLHKSRAVDKVARPSFCDWTGAAGGHSDTESSDGRMILSHCGVGSRTVISKIKARGHEAVNRTAI